VPQAPSAPAVQAPTQQRPPQIVHTPPDDEPQQPQPEIDPNLFSYPEPTENGHTNGQSYPYPEHHHYSEYQSLEQIASEVLDMNGGATGQHVERPEEDFIERQLNQIAFERYSAHHSGPSHQSNGTAAHTNGTNGKPDGSVDSAVSLPRNGALQQNGTSHDPERSVDDRLREALSADSFGGFHEMARPSVETNGYSNGHSETAHRPATASSQTSASALPLFQPPPPLSISPELKKQIPVLRGSTSPSAQKRRRESLDVAAASKRAKINGLAEAAGSALAFEDEELARTLQQEERGLRQRSKS
jgi:F-box and leucine-rich repeat protein 10/11